jgi:hypothetical protein
MVGEITAPKYANGLLIKKKPIAYGLELKNINGPWFINQEGISVCAKGEVMNTDSDLDYLIDEILGYKLDADTLSILTIVNEQYLMFSYHNNEMVSNSNPDIKLIKTMDELGIIEDYILLTEPPLLIYYWKIIAMVLIAGWVYYLYLTIKKLIWKPN